MKAYAALDIRSADTGLLYALLDDFEPTAVEELEHGLRAFFRGPALRDLALSVLSPRFEAAAVDVPDEDWARRSQESLTPVVVGTITVAPPWSAPESLTSALVVVIAPSMGFGTGHHATTRLCLAALQALDLRKKTVLDVGTGSGVLALAAAGLGAARACGVDIDPDAIQSARENLVLNPAVHGVSFEVADLTSTPFPAADVVTANLTGALLVRSAPVLLAATGIGGSLVLSGLLADERDQVVRAFEPAIVVWERQEDGWVGLGVKKPS